MEINSIRIGLCLVITVASSTSCFYGKSGSDQKNSSKNIGVNAGTIRSEPDKTTENSAEAEETVTALSKLLKVPLLKHAVSTGDVELRVWSVPGTQYPSCLVLKRLRGIWKAHLISPDFESIALDSDKINNIPFTVSDELKPRTTSSVDLLLDDAGVTERFGLLPDRDITPPIPDEGELYIEYRHVNNYNVVGYRMFTKSNSGTKAMKLCLELRTLFGITIDCFEHTE